jgi:hypothetical protein
MVRSCSELAQLWLFHPLETDWTKACESDISAFPGVY